MCPTGYYTMIRSKNHKFDIRHHLVMFAQRDGIRKAARQFGCSRNTVRRWLRRYKQQGLRGLDELPRRPKRIPHKTGPEIERLVVEARKQAPCFGPRRLKDEFELPCGLSAIARILRQSGLTRKKKRKFRKKRDLREIKAKYQPLTRFHMDVKYLTDIPNYVGQMNSPEYPSHQYTIRCLSTGATFLTFADGVSKTYATITVRRFLSHLKKFNIPLNEVVIQTDTGAEFTGPRGFTQAVEEEFGAHHRLVRRPNPNANADVESFHNTIEEEFYDLERFPAARSFWEKISTYSAYYNLARVNYSRGRKTPLELLQTARPDISPQVLLLPPVDVAKLLSLDCESERASQSEKCSLKRRRPRREEVGHHVPKLPENQ